MFLISILMNFASLERRDLVRFAKLFSQYFVHIVFVIL